MQDDARVFRPHRQLSRIEGAQPLAAHVTGGRLVGLGVREAISRFQMVATADA